MQKKIIFIVGLPGTKKSFIRHFFENQKKIESYKWSDLFVRALGLDRKDLTLDDVDDLISKELRTPSYLCETVIKSRLINNRKEFVLIDGTKNKSQCTYLSHILNRDCYIIKTIHDETKRLKSISERKQFDDIEDARRLSQLNKLGLGELLQYATFTVNTTNVEVTINRKAKKAKIVLTDKFCDDLLNIINFLAFNNFKSKSQIIDNYKKEFINNNFDLVIESSE